ncbi:zinc-ribbon domain-containing protein [Companilactobacillus versmoldensis]|uniref:Zinc-ribbon domain-containing protein n=1 Tax=Companilactobacillus versmoldensis DSM 14857 = KCTC 3814 TaxID=1423815 RepID=A0A0R1SA93_9LACO|nr:zinc-ribbon domain-containing protein [Companilactobacillus versmoldensis]KRL65905.1 hypothetical protein FC27_GL001197 [Companilactobacillus versmoldensis DSM 14857 = KCTC 3814]
MKFCTNCGFKLYEDDRFCPKCGTQQRSVENNNVNETAVDYRFDAEVNVPQNNLNYNQQPNNLNYYGQQNAYTEGFTIGQPHHFSIEESVSYIFANIFDFNPKVQDNQMSIFWWNYLLFCMEIVMVAPLLTAINIIVTVIATEVILILLLPSMMRRLNYLGKNKNLAWLSLLPAVSIYPFILMFTNRKN